MRESYWNTMTQYKFALLCYSAQFNKSVRIDRTINICFAVLSTTSIGLWAFLNQYALIWGIIIVVIQVASVIMGFFPYRRRYEEINELSTKLNTIYCRMEHDWYKVNIGEFSPSEINDLRSKYVEEWNNTGNLYFQRDSLSIGKRVKKQAESQRDLYFQNVFSSEEARHE